MEKRIQQLREKMIQATPGICTQRALLMTRAYQEYAAYPPIVKRAYGFARVLREMSLYIEEEQLLCGNQASKPRYAPVFPEYTMDWVIEELDSYANRPSDAFAITEQAKKELREMAPFWKGQTLMDRTMAMQADAVLTDLQVKVLGWLGNVSAGEGHIVPDYDTLLREGYIGLRQRVLEKRDGLDIADPDDLRKKPFYDAGMIVMDGILDYLARCADLARELAQTAGGQRKAELLAMCECSRALAKRAPQSFYEAVQLVWYTQLILHIQTNGQAISFGRIDQYLYPFYQKDIRDGRLTESSALEIVECLFLAVFSINKLRSWSNSQFQLGYPTYQNMCLGGSNPAGEDETNQLSFLFLEALGEIRLSEPNVYVRCHTNINRQFLRKAVGVIKTGIGMPAFVGDKVITQALMMRGVAEEDAYNFSTMGCTETVVPGKWGYKATGKAKVNLLKILEIALYGGVDPRTGIRVMDGVAPLEEYTCYEDAVFAYRQVLEYYMRLEVSADNINDLAMEELVPDAFSSLLIQDCINRGKTIKQGGAVYDMVSGLLSAVIDVGNCLYALKKTVFEDKLFTPAQLKDAMENNFEGAEGIQMQATLKNLVAKYGNDEDGVDQVVVESSDYYFKHISKYKNTRYGRGPIGGVFTSSTVNMSGNVPSGAIVGAMPNGRKAGEATAEGISPQHGSEKNGPTSVIKSATKLSTRYVTGGQLFNMRINPMTLQREDQIDKFLDMILSYFDLEGWHIQFNVVSNEVLRDAQQNPKNYRDLVVRVAGYSALFTVLDKTTQDDIIERSQYAI